MKIDLERLLPNHPEETDIQLIEVGNGRYPALVVDNFYRDPDHMRDFALSLHYRIPPGVYPGHWAEMSLSLEAVVSSVYERFARWYFPSAAVMAAKASSWQFLNNERRAGDPPRPSSHRPHVDIGLLVGLVYLNKPEHCRGGTAFFRHQDTGAEAVLPKEIFEYRGLIDPAIRDRVWQHGAHLPYDKARETGLVTDYADYWKRIAETPGDEQDNIIDGHGGWDLTRVVEMKYNRLLLFPGFVLHSPQFRAEWFGNTPETWRLTQNFMFYWPVTAL
jgi:hypothetical protein